MELGLNGKAALIGGASKGIGRAVALGLARMRYQSPTWQAPEKSGGLLLSH